MSAALHTVGIIPARIGSSRLPAKPLLDLCGKPMIRHVYERAAKARSIDRLIVATDSEEIARVVREFGGEAMMTPVSLRTGSDRVAAVAQSLPQARIIVNIQGDEPLIAPAMIDEAAAPMLGRSSGDPPESFPAATLVKRILSADELSNPNTVKVVLDRQGCAVYFSRSPIPYLRDGAPMSRWVNERAYYKHIGLYVYRKEFLLEFASWEQSDLERTEQLEQLRIIEHGVRIKATLTGHDSTPVDTPADADRVRLFLRSTEGVSTP